MKTQLKINYLILATLVIASMLLASCGQSAAPDGDAPAAANPDGVTTINLWENDQTRPSRETRDQIFVAFVSADIEFWNGGNPGVRLIRNREG